MVKTSDRFDRNVKELSSFNRENLRKTLSSLLGKPADDTYIQSLKVEGLKILIMHMLKNLMPRKCGVCVSAYYKLPMENPKVKCFRCSKMACPKFFEDIIDANLRYVCNDCEEEVKSQVGEGSLIIDHFKCSVSVSATTNFT